MENKEVNNKRVVGRLPMKKGLVDWIKEFDDKGIDVEGKSFNKVRELLDDNYMPVFDKRTKETFNIYYKNGFSINEISDLFKVSKQYVDKNLNRDLKEGNVKNRAEYVSDIGKVFYVEIPEKYGFEKLKEFGSESRIYYLNNKYKEHGGKQELL